MARRGSGEGPHGLVVIDKEPGWTSHDVVAKLRGLLGQRRTGHAGTLDPSATGVLLIGVGKATRLMRFLQDTTKSYEGELQLGSTTTTLDSDGEVTQTFDMSGVGIADLESALPSLTGAIQQVPPMVSALKVDGKRLHELAREGVEIERAARPVTVHSFTLEPTEVAGRFRFVVSCSSGTYVRSLVDDLGRLVGGGAHMTALRRTQVGAFSLSDSHLLAEVAERSGGSPREADFSGILLSPLEALRGMQRRLVSGDELDRVRHGAALTPDDLGDLSIGPVAVCDEGGDLLAVYELVDSGKLTASVVLLSS